jgi:hypothetical protein
LQYFACNFKDIFLYSLLNILDRKKSNYKINIKVAEKVNQLEQARLYIEEIQGLNKIESLQENENDEVYKLAYHMVEKFFSDDV